MKRDRTTADLVDAATRRLTPVRRALVEALGDDVAATTWLVGGVVRDALLDRTLLDVDLATTGDPEQVARTLARLVRGTAFALGDGHGCWRVAVGDAPDGLDPALAEVLQIDVCATRGSTIEHDVDERDFTANALAMPLVGEPVIVDRHDGLADITAGRIRMVSTASLDADPLRMLRAARIAHLLDWDIDEVTVAAVRERAHRAAEPAGERTFAELELLLLHPEARRGWRLLERLGLDTVLLPELEACRGLQQSRFHHLDVHDHTLAVLDNCEDLLAATDFWLGTPTLDAPVAPWTSSQRLVVLLAALTHDLGKPATRALRPDGRVSFVGHDDVGAEIVDQLAARWRWSTSMRTQVRRLVGTHLDLGFVLHTPAGARERWRLRRTLEPVVAEAVVLSVGDRLATAGPDDRRRWVRSHIELARKIWHDHWHDRAHPTSPLLDGRELAAAAGITPGPALGELVRALAEEQAVGAIDDRDAAIAFIQRRISESTGPTP